MPPQVLPFAEPSDGQKPAAPFKDPFGERTVSFESRLLTSVELLQFKPELSGSAAFEAAIRESVEQTRPPESMVIPAIAVDRRDGALTLVLRQVTGRRVSELLPQTRGSVMATEFLRQTVTALAALTINGRRFGHGALTLDRVFATSGQRMVLAEYSLGAGVEALGWTRDRLQCELGLVVPEDTAAFDARIDAIQIGFGALSLWLGRPLDPADFPGKIPELIDEAAIVTGATTPAGARMLAFAERLLQVGARPFGSAREAQGALTELTTDQRTGSEVRPAVSLPSMGESAAASKPAFVPSNPVGVPYRPAVATYPAVAAPAAAATRQAPAVASLAPPVAPARSARQTRSGRNTWRLWAAGAAVLILALASGLLLSRDRLFGQAQPPTGAPAVPGRAPAADTAAQVPVAPAPEPTTPPARAAAAAPAPPPTRDGTPHFGAMSFVAPVELQIYEGGKHIGSTVGPVAILEGVHSIELSNSAIGFVVQESVTVKPGDLTTRTIRLPNGKLSINAVPWAEVWIDGTSVGQTPLANLSVTVGEHQIVFKHPEFGDQRQTALVKADGITRISATMQR